MPDVQFESEGIPQTYYRGPVTPPSFFVRMAKKLGAKDDRQANAVLLGVAVVFFLVSFVVFYLQFRTPAAENVSPESLGEIPGAEASF